MTLIWLFALLWLLGWAFAQTLLPFAIEWLKRSSGDLGSRPRRVLLVCALPWLVPLTATAAMALLAVAKHLGWVPDHCLAHTPHHPHFCFEHLPQMLFGHGHGHALIAGILFTLFALLTLRHGWRLYRQSANLKALTALSEGSGPLRLLEDPRSLAFVGGTTRPYIYFSQGLKNQLNRRERRMVFVHEVAHIRHRDLLLNHWVEFLLLAHIKPYARALQTLWVDAIEMRADDKVAQRFGRVTTAELLLRLAQSTQLGPTVTAFGGGNTATRIDRLINHPASSRKTTPVFEGLLGLGLLAVMTTLLTQHHTLETLIGLLVFL